MSISAVVSSAIYAAQVQPVQRPPAVVSQPPQAAAQQKTQPAASASSSDNNSDGSGLGSIIDVRA
jgi:hypothetical protein